MALQTTVKISGVTNLSDARYCAGMGVTMLGFGMDADAPTYLNPARFAEIRGWVSGVQIVGETDQADPDQIGQLVEIYAPDLVQVGDPALLPMLAGLGKPLILRLDLTTMTVEQLETLAPTPAPTYLLLDGPAEFDLSPALRQALRLVSTRLPVLLGAGLTPENVLMLLRTVPVNGIALAGGSEDRPGQREFGTLMDILELLETDD